MFHEIGTIKPATRHACIGFPRERRIRIHDRICETASGEQPNFELGGVYVYSVEIIVPWAKIDCGSSGTGFSLCDFDFLSVRTPTQAEDSIQQLEFQHLSC